MQTKAGRLRLPGIGSILALALLLVACSDIQPVSGLQFARVWQDSYTDAEISWWYLGEDEEHFYLEEKWPNGEAQFMVPKAFIVISGIARTRYGTAPEPVSLSRDNLEFM
jgi:aminopeptidase-like protein